MKKIILIPTTDEIRVEAIPSKELSLEEAAEEYKDTKAKGMFFDAGDGFSCTQLKEAFIAGAKHQATKMYSENDMLKAFSHGVYKQLMGNSSKYLTFEEWIKEFNNNKK